MPFDFIGREKNVPAAIWLCSLLIQGAFSAPSRAAAEGAGDYIHYRLGVKYKEEKKYDRSIDEFRKVLAAYPDNYNAYFHMAQIRSEQNRPRLVIYNLKKALSYNPGWSKAQKMLAAALEKDGQYQKAILELQQYQQVSDPAERDSVQREIDRLIGLVSSGNASAGNKQDITVTARTGEDTVSAAITRGTSDARVKKPAEPGKRPANSFVTADAQFDEAVELYNRERFKESLVLLRQVLARRPGHAGAYYYAGLIRYREKQYRMAIVNLRKGLDFPETGINAHFYLGKIYGEQKQYGQAIAQLFKYIKKSTYEPGKEEARKLIESYRSLGGSAVLEALAPGAPATTAVTDTMQPNDRFLSLEVRIDSLLTMMTVDTLSDAGRKLLGGIREFTKGNYDGAIIEFKKVLATHPSGTVALNCLYNIGICYLRLRLFKEAENQFQQVLERHAQHPAASKALFFKGITALERSESAVAEKLFRKFIQDHRSHEWIGNAYEKLGDAYIDMEDRRKAVDAFSQAVSLSSGTDDRVAVLFKLGKVFQELGNGKRAIETFQRAIDTGEKASVYMRVPDSYYRIADECYRMKDYKKALDAYLRVTRKYPAFQETPWGLFQIGSIYKQLGKYQDAIDMFKELMKKYPEDYWARQAQWKMEDTIWEHEYKAVLR